MQKPEIFTRFDEAFWASLDALVQSSELVLDRPKGTRHPRYTDFIYPVDYGYLAGTITIDGGGIDVWKGTSSAPADYVEAILCTADPGKRDAEIKIVLCCTDAELATIYEAHNSGGMHGMLIPR